jgi:hypothetical protein
VQNKAALAEECRHAGLYDEAISLYEKVLSGVYKDDPDFLLGLSKAYFSKEAYQEARDVLTRLVQIHPDSKLTEHHILLARSLERLNDTDAAVKMYKVIAENSRDEEAQCRYGLLLKKLGDTEKAREIFGQMLKRAQRGPAQYRKANKQWFDIAKQNLV